MKRNLDGKHNRIRLPMEKLIPKWWITYLCADETVPERQNDNGRHFPSTKDRGTDHKQTAFQAA